MTREEAILCLKGIKNYGRDTFTEQSDWQDSLDMAIKALEQEPTTKKNLGVDCVARQDVERYIEGFINEYTPEEELEFINLELDGLKHLPPATPQEPFINKPCVSSGVCEHDKQKVLDKLRAEIETKYGRCKLTEYIVQYDGICTGANDIGDIADILQIIDKYKAESEPQESEG